MRILTICHDHPAVTNGGTEYIAHDLHRSLNDMPGISSRFLAVSTALSHPDEAPGALHSMGTDYLLRTGGYDIFSMRRNDGSAWVASMAKLLDQTRPDIVHLHGLDRIGADVIAVLRRLCPKARLVLTLHDFQLICPNDGLLLRKDGGLCMRPEADACRRCFPEIAVGGHALRKARLMALLQQIDAFIAPSRDLCGRYVTWGLPEERITVVPNAVPAQDPMARSARSKPNRFAFFGNFAPHKGVDVLLKSAHLLSQQRVDLRISLYGRLTAPSDERARDFADQLAAASPIAQSVGPYDRQEVHGLMAQTDWVVLPSLWFENAPLVVLEAQRARVPVICTALGGMQELVRHGVDGLHVPRGDPAALAEVLAQVAGDAELHARLRDGIRPPQTLAQYVTWHLHHYQALQEGVVA